MWLLFNFMQVDFIQHRKSDFSTLLKTKGVTMCFYGYIFFRFCSQSAATEKENK